MGTSGGIFFPAGPRGIKPACSVPIGRSGPFLAPAAEAGEGGALGSRLPPNRLLFTLPLPLSLPEVSMKTDGGNQRLPGPHSAAPGVLEPLLAGGSQRLLTGPQPPRGRGALGAADPLFPQSSEPGTGIAARPLPVPLGSRGSVGSAQPQGTEAGGHVPILQMGRRRP